MTNSTPLGDIPRCGPLPTPIAGSFLKVRLARGRSMYFTQTMIRATREFSWCLPEVNIWVDRAFFLVRESFR